MGDTMNRRGVGRNAFIVLFCINMLYVLSGLLLTGFSHFFRNTKYSDYKPPKTVNSQKHGFFYWNDSMSSLEFRKSGRIVDCNLEKALFWQKSDLKAELLHILWITISILAVKITLRRCIHVQYMQNADGKKWSIPIFIN